MVTVISNNEQKVLFSFNPVTAGGNPAQVENLKSEVLEGDAVVNMNDDGKSGEIVSGSVTTNKIRFTADADLGEGVSEISEDVDYIVVAAQASNLGFSTEVVPK